MAGPHPSNHAVGTDGPLPYPDDAASPSATYPAAYPGQLPPPVSYPERRPKRLLIGTLVAIALVAAMTAAIVYGVRTNGANTGATFSEVSAKTAIQGYLDALEHHDIDTIARNALCGIYDGVRDRRSDQALAKLSSDAFRKQFSRAEVTSIDKIVYLSQYQTQVLFTMQVTPATGGPPKGQVQGIAQVLFQRGQILVCSYVLRTIGGRY
ncbi:Rv0361 family membrane protein [Mycobacterium lacus]|uniref:DUF8174 domain-containing protein n=1 Tax=Mycobacterium lacus TaxID=169765 RepID=A0A1X1XYG2_9MYCO|nr:hypothetical protein [Mycobacterium lacus]MCV7125260.1 hypothetical protein [Mycobacterium lacus]ORW03794.1 hypothetical protein AWC15_04565 [Mycobacterium lacus]BBX96918.1 hypothetical protein MLAC_22120 [Mycobacterium lacus]